MAKEHSMNRNRKTSEEISYCYFHPKQVVIGVCPLCLNERLLLLQAAKQGHSHSASSRASKRFQSSKHTQRKPSPPTNSIHKLFAFTSLFTRPHSHSHHWKSHNHYYDASPSPEDSFISIKFEGNGVASWEKNTVSEVSLENCSMSWNHPSLMIPNNKDTGKSVIEHGKSRDLLRWRKRIGHMFHVIRWKKSIKPTTCHVGSNKVEGVKMMRKGWMRTLTKRKTKA